MIQTFIIYAILIGIMIFFSIPLYSDKRINIYSNKKEVSLLHFSNKITSFIIPIILLSLICGFRYGIGEDYFSYEILYNNLDINDIQKTLRTSREEPLFTILMFYLKKFNLPYSALLFCCSFISYFFLYKSLNNHFKEIRPIASLFFFITGTFFIYMSFIRQMIAFFIFLYAIKFIINRNIIKYILAITICVLFHKSSILLYPCYFIGYLSEEFIKKTYIIQIVISLLTILKGEVITNFIISSALNVISNSIYGGYSNKIASWTIDVGSGKAAMLIMIINLLIITISPKLISAYSKVNFKTYYTLFFIGSCLDNLFYNNVLLSRIPVFWIHLKFLIIAYAFHHLIVNWKICSLYYKSVCLFILLFFIAYFYSMIYNGAMNSSPFILKI